MRMPGRDLSHDGRTILPDNRKFTETEIDLAPKEKLFVEEFVSNGCNKFEAVKKAYDTSPKKTYDKAGKLMSNRLVRKAIVKKMLEKGITPDKLMTVLKGGLNATRIVEYQGEATSTELPDYAERRKSAHVALELFDAFPKKDNIEVKNYTLAMKFEGMPLDQLENIITGYMAEINAIKRQNGTGDGDVSHQEKESD